MKGTPPKLHRFRDTWMTAQQIAVVTGLKVRTVHRRIQFGLPIEGQARRGPEPQRYELRGRLVTAREIMEETGLSRSQVSKRTDGVRFFGRDEATDPNAPLHPNAHVLFFRGISDSICGWARRTGIPHHVIRERINTMGWPVKRALTEPVMRKGQRQCYQRNAEIIRRMLVGVHAPAPNIANSTGGYIETSTPSTGTGAGRHALHLQTEKELSP